MVKVVLESVTKRFGEVEAVDDVNLEINDGEFFTLVGPSGCGKTTTCRLIAGLESPDAGEIHFGDETVNDWPPKARNVAMVFQTYALYPNMTVFRNIEFPLKLKKMEKDERKSKVISTAEMLEIGHLLDRKPHQLSGGQQQRVALARALVREPNVFLLDEPLSNLDAKLRVSARSEIKRLQQKLKITTIYVTHDQVEALAMSDRMAVMNSGKIQQVGNPLELYDNPANLFIAGFLGTPSMNLIQCTLIEENGFFVLDMGTFKMKIPTDLEDSMKAYSRKDLIIGIRPQDIEITQTKTKNSTDCEVVLIEPLGAGEAIHVRVDELMLRIISRLRTGYRIGERAYICFDFRKVCIFDSVNEQAISMCTT